MKASTHVLASMLRRGTASNHLVDLSMMVSRYTWPSEEAGRGPTRSTCTGMACWLLVNLPPLALLAINAHGCHVSAHALPHETCSYHPPGSPYARVRHVVDGVEHGQPIHQWYQWPSNATYHVSQQTGSLYLDSPYCQKGRLRRLQRAWIANLIGRHPVERDAYRRLHVSHAPCHAM
jgi:hypothetical protein